MQALDQRAGGSVRSVETPLWTLFSREEVVVYPYHTAPNPKLSKWYTQTLTHTLSSRRHPTTVKTMIRAPRVKPSASTSGTTVADRRRYSRSPVCIRPLRLQHTTQQPKERKLTPASAEVQTTETRSVRNKKITVFHGWVTRPGLSIHLSSGEDEVIQSHRRGECSIYHLKTSSNTLKTKAT